MASEVIREILPDAESLAKRAVELFLEASPRVVALAGGATPRRTYELLSEREYPWEGVDVFVTDERWVPPEHPESNWTMVSKLLVEKVGALGHPFDYPGDPTQAALRYESNLKKKMPIDFAFLGLGQDGHTASLFPGDPACDVRDSLVVATESSYSGFRRLTLTFVALNQVNNVIFLVSGAGKREAFEKLLTGSDIPAVRVRGMKTTTILADSDAAIFPA